MDTALGILACLMPLVLAAIMIQTRRDAASAIARLDRRCDEMQQHLAAHRVFFNELVAWAKAPAAHGHRVDSLVVDIDLDGDLGRRQPGSDAP